MLQRWYEKLLRMSNHQNAPYILAFIAFAESSIFPIPPDVMLIPMCMANRHKAWTYGLICSVASVLGAYVGYGIGYAFFEMIGHPVLEFYNLMPSFENFQDKFNEYGFWIILGKGLTPIPFKIVTIASGVTELDLGTFSLACVLSRFPRFMLFSFMVWRYGAYMQGLMERNLKIVTCSLVVALILGIYLLKFF